MVLLQMSYRGLGDLLVITAPGDQSRASSLSDQQEDEESREITTVNYCMKSYMMLTPSCIKNKIRFCFAAEKKLKLLF